MCELIWRKSENGAWWWLSPRNWDGGSSVTKFRRGGGASVIGMGKMAPGGRGGGRKWKMVRAHGIEILNAEEEGH
jgi:hypothetical protein